MTPSAPVEPPVHSYGRSAARGAAWLGAVQVVRLALTLLSTVVIARLLSPADYGVIAMIGPLFALLGMFQDLGLNAATIQVAAMDRARSNALFWLGVAASALLAGLALAIAPAVAWFYGDWRPGLATAAAAGGLVISGLALQPAALLNREMRFAALAQIEIASLVATYGVTFALALWLRSWWALVLGTLAGSAVQSTLSWRAERFRPSRPAFRGIGEMARFGSHVTAANLLNFCVRNADDVIVAKVAGAAQAGLYDRSYRLMMLPLQQLNGPLARLLQPILARLRDEPERFRRTFVLASRALMLACVPPIAIGAALSGQLMPFLLGRQWLGAGPIFFWLGLVGLVQPLGNLSGILYYTSGRTRALVQWSVASAIVTLAAFALGAQGGAIGIATALFFSALARLPFLFWWSTRGTSVRARDLWAAQMEPLLGAGAVAVGAWALQGSMPFLVLLPAATLLAYLAAFLISAITPNGRRALTDLWTYAAEHLPTRFKRARRSAAG